MFSYGSGLTSTMFSFKINEGQHPFSLLEIEGKTRGEY
jgi:hydroxymethylglutaryl-CoA synthase